MTEKKLKLNIEGSNIFNKLAIEAVTQASSQLVPFVNSKVFLSEGGLSKKLKEAFKRPDVNIPESNYRVFVHHAYLNSNFNITRIELRFQIFVSDGDRLSEYFDRDIELGDVKDGILLNLTPIDKIVNMYGFDRTKDYETLRKNIIEYQKLQKQADAIKSKYNLGSEMLNINFIETN